MTTKLYQFNKCRGDIENMNGFLTCTKGTGNAPPGSYAESCMNMFVQGTTLTAECQKVNKSWDNTMLNNFNQCRTDLENFDGFLSCDKGTGDCPPGSYKETCRNRLVEGTTLSASCETEQGTWNNTSLNEFEKCRGDIGNMDGNLTCNKGTVSVSTPPPTEQCLVTVTITNETCYNVDGTVSSILVPHTLSTLGCGGTQALATERAMASLETQTCLTQSSNPTPGCCTYSTQTSQGCACKQ
jgi:hypothetical protein